MRRKRRVFIDTSYLVALLDRRDSLHERALALNSELVRDDATLVTSDVIFLELANYFARGPLRTHAIDWIAAIRAASSGWTLLALERAHCARGEARYRKHDDKGWSLTDCIAMELMLELRLKEIATYDAGFEQAGFRALLR